MIFAKKVARTFLRTKETMNKYLTYLAEQNSLDTPSDPFTDIEDRAIKKFKYWLIIENSFPYDAIASTSHLLFTRRTVAFDWSLLTKEERDELEQLKKTYIRENYDLLWENMPVFQSVPGHFHLHLLKLKRE